MYGYFIPTVNLMGAGAVSAVGKQAKIIGGTKALVVTDKPLVSIGIAEKVIKLLNEVGIQTVLYDNVMPNPTDKNVHDGVDLYKKENCDIIIAVGGGSPIDCAKGIGLVSSNGMPPSLTAATGMDALTHAVEAYVSTIATPITDSAALKAIQLISQYLRPAVANGKNMEARDKMAYAKIEIMTYGWWNCAIDNMFRVEDNGKCGEEFQKLFTNLESQYYD